MRQILIIIAVVAAVMAVSYVLTGAICWPQAVVGFPCPGCGSTRAVFLMLSGQIIEAHVYQPLILISLATLVYAGLKIFVFQKSPVSKTETAALVVVAVLFTLVYIVRLAFLFPHTPPMTINEDALLRQLFNFIAG